MEETRITIITPCFNDSKLISETLGCILNQSYNCWEYFVVDDGSTDGTQELVKKYAAKDSRLQFVQRPKTLPKGANACRNLGAEMSTGEYLIFLDSDDLLSLDALEKMSELIEKSQPKLLVNRTRSFVIETNDRDFKPFEIASVKSAYNAFNNYKILWSTVSVLWNKDFFNELGCFDLKLNRFQDYELHLRALGTMKEGEAVFFPTKSPLCFYRQSNFHKTINLEKMRMILKDAKYVIDKSTKNFPEKLKSGFFDYLIRRYNIVFEPDDYNYLKRMREEHDLISETQIMKAQLLRPFKFNLFINKVLSYLLFKL